MHIISFLSLMPLILIISDKGTYAMRKTLIFKIAVINHLSILTPKTSTRNCGKRKTFPNLVIQLHLRAILA